MITNTLTLMGLLGFARPQAARATPFSNLLLQEGGRQANREKRASHFASLLTLDHIPVLMVNLATVTQKLYISHDKQQVKPLLDALPYFGRL